MGQLMGFAVLAWPITLLMAFLLVFVVVVSIVLYATRNKKSGWKWGWGAALLVYLAVFWDHIPTVVAHRYYCEKEAGFWVYKTLDQWKAENPGVLETLVYKRDMPHLQTPYGNATMLNQRFLHIYKYEGPLPFNRWRVETEIRDSQNGEVITREIDFSTSQERRQAGWSGWKFWLNNEHCNVENHRDHGSFGQITAQIEGAKK